MGLNIKLGRIFGIPIGINASWFIIFGLVTLSLSTSYFPTQNPSSPFFSNLLIGVAASLLLFGSVLAHELGHAFIALRNNIPVRQITLFLLGGVAQIEEEPKTAGAEFRVAIAGPLVSFTLAILFGALSLLDQVSPLISAPSAYLARANLILLGFNMLPGYPLDGGRVLRAAIWKFTNDPTKATKIATTAGQIIAYGMMGIGLYLAIVQGDFATGLWLGFIGFYLRNAAAASQRHAALTDSLKGVTVEQVMNRNLYYVPNLITLRQLVDDYVFSQGKKQFIVTNTDEVLGFLTTSDVFRVSKHKWPYITTAQAMTPVDHIRGVPPDMDITAAMKEVNKSKNSSIPVIFENRIVGALSNEDLNSYINLRTRFSY